MKMLLKSGLMALAIAATVGLMPASAATVDISAQNPSVFGDATGANKWYVGVSYTNGTETRNNVGAGVFRLQGSYAGGETSKFLAFCLSPFEWLRLPLQYTVGTDLNDSVVGRLASLVNVAWSKIADSDTAAAFQLAAWEIVSEQNGNPLNITEGLFRVTSINSQAAGTYAQSWLNDVQSGNFKANLDQITIFSADNTQDLLTGDLPPAPVPLPGAIGLMLMGLAALGGVAKARRA
jgi:hypothetical protein